MPVPNLTIETSTLAAIFTLIYGSYTGDGLLADELFQIPFHGFDFRSEF